MELYKLDVREGCGVMYSDPSLAARTKYWCAVTIALCGGVLARFAEFLMTAPQADKVVPMFAPRLPDPVHEKGASRLGAGQTGLWC